METRKKNWKPEQGKIVRAFAKAFGISHIYDIGYKVFADAVRENGMEFSGTFWQDRYVNTTGDGLVGKEFCGEYSDKGGRKYWYVFDLAPFSGEAYTVFETAKPRSEKILRSTLEVYEMLLNAIEVDADRLNEFWKIDVGDAETPWDAMKERLYYWVRGRRI
jgi:hypothetical protein